ncbi:MAG TPA: hypothetical protein VH020_06695, partial [Stellaceae bacterium]|nr:hypothetical protein [Stellaceae bacterium]
GPRIHEYVCLFVRVASVEKSKNSWVAGTSPAKAVVSRRDKYFGSLAKPQPDSRGSSPAMTKGMTSTKRRRR